MENIKTAEDLKNAIRQLEQKKVTEWFFLKEQMQHVYESSKPINIIKRTLKEVVSSPDIRTTALDAAIGLTTGFIAKKLFVGNTGNPLTKVLGFFLETFVANNVSKNTDGIKSIGSLLLKKIVNHKEDPEKA